MAPATAVAKKNKIPTAPPNSGLFKKCIKIKIFLLINKKINKTKITLMLY